MGPGNLEGAEGRAEGSFVKAASLHLHGSPGGPQGTHPATCSQQKLGTEHTGDAPCLPLFYRRGRNRERGTASVRLKETSSKIRKINDPVAIHNVELSYPQRARKFWNLRSWMNTAGMQTC